jgi:RND family efflux transporter MFP subunit
MSPRIKVYGFLLVLAVLAGGGYLGNQQFGWFGAAAQAKATNGKGKDGKGKDAKKGETKEATPVELTQAKRGEISSYIPATANLRALRDVAVATQTDGIVQEVLAEEGDFVKDGQVLVKLDEEPIRIRLELATQRLAQARMQADKAKLRLDKLAVQIEHSRREYDRYFRANKEGLVSEQESDRRKLTLDEQLSDQRITQSEIKELSHRVSELESEIAQVKLDLSRTSIKTPFAGYITRRTVEIGQRVRALESLFQVGAFSPLYADVFVSEQEARQIRPNQQALVRLGVDPDLKTAGRIERISPIVDQSTGTIKVTVEVRPTEMAFRPGAFVRVDIRTETRRDALLIPKRALVEEDGENYVFVAAGDTARRTRVSLGFENEGTVEIRSGLSAGQKIVVAGQGALKEGAKIKETRS